ncbi:phBC6A51 family helix-turn-helix protein [Cohnella sp. GCM10020058]|uniref:phBC6A51 family helix-turn-helix protein n=1 Tax=Cohnella sp. GCM10020058 TaxID=3317330 RepID=UPI003638E1FF
MVSQTLSAAQLTAIQFLAFPKAQRPSIEEIAAECRVSKATIYNWQRDPVFEQELLRQIVRYARDDLPDIVAAVTSMAIADRNAAGAKLALQINGMLTDKLELRSTAIEQRPTDIEALKARVEALRARGATTDAATVSSDQTSEPA